MKCNQYGASDFSIVMMLLLGAVAVSLVTSFNSCVKNYNRVHRQGWVEVPADYEGDSYVEEQPKTLYDYE